MHNDHQILIDYRVSQVQKTSKEIEALIKNGFFAMAINRIYFAMYYSLSALALKNDFKPQKYAELREWFNANFVRSGKIDRFFGKILHNAYADKNEGDYGMFVKFEKEEVQKKFRDMKIFISEIDKFLGNVSF